jgi:dTDP-4-dehydrorhamnose 3,5-epimerase
VPAGRDPLNPAPRAHWTPRAPIRYGAGMEIRKTALAGVTVLVPRRFGDARGYFAETWSARALAAAGLGHAFVQDNESLSARAGTLRGLHYQAPPHAQAKLVRVVQGAVLDVAVDVRVGSPTFGAWVAEELSAANGAQLLVPQGFLHGFLTLADDTLVLYKVDSYYDRESDGAVAWDDPDIGIDWGIAPDRVILSDKDRAAPRLADWRSPFAFEPSP